MIQYQAIYRQRVADKVIKPAAARLLSFDPGGTTGTALFKHEQYQGARQFNTSHMGIALESLNALFDEALPTAVVMEDYRVYASKQEQHVGSDLSTPRLIGMIETICLTREIPYHKQGAGDIKHFCTDDKLKAWSLHVRGQKHSRDAIRHGIYFILFPPKVMASNMITRRRTTGQHVG